MSLDKIIEKVVLNEEIHELLTDAVNKKFPLWESPYRKLVEFQVKACEEHNSDIAAEGYQVGEPWVGDIENARVLFLSSNPSFTFSEDYIRYHAAARTLCVPGRGEFNTANDKGVQEAVQASKAFFTERFQTADVSARQVLRVKCLGAGKLQSVYYWSCIRNSIETLMPPAALKQISGGRVEDRVHSLMKYALSMELVPFKSKREVGVQAAMFVCMREFAGHILPHVKAPVVVLVGKKVRKAFLDFAVTAKGERAAAAQAFGQQAVYRYKGNLNPAEKWVVAVDFSQGRFSLAGHSKAVLNALTSKLIQNTQMEEE